MSRFAAIAEADATPGQRTLFDAARKAYGRVAVVVRQMAHAPEGVSLWLALEGALKGGSLPTRELETVKLLASEHTGCAYCLSIHWALAKRAGFTESQAEALRRGQAIGDARIDALSRLVRTLLETRGEVPADTMAAARAAGYTERQMTEVALAIAAITFTNTFKRMNATAAELPPAPALSARGVDPARDRGV